MKTTQVLLDQGGVCLDFAKRYAAEVAKRAFTAKRADAFAQSVAALEKVERARRGAAAGTAETGEQVSTMTAQASEALRRAHLAFELAARTVGEKQRAALAPILALKKSKGLGAARLAEALNTAADATAATKAAAALKELAGWGPDDHRQLASFAAELKARHKQRGDARGEQGKAVRELAAASKSVNALVEQFKLVFELALPEESAAVDELHQRLRAAEAKGRKRRGKSGGGTAGAGSPGPAPSA